MSYAPENQHKGKRMIKEFFGQAAPYVGSAPIKFVHCAVQNPNFMSTGQGSYSMHLLTYAADLEIGIFTGGFNFTQSWFLAHFFHGDGWAHADDAYIPHFLGRSTPHFHLSPSDRNIAKYPRLAVVSETAMRATWSSSSSTPQLASIIHIETGRSWRQPSTPRVYTRSDLCGAPANKNGWHEQFHQHTVVFEDLLPGEVYEYGVAGTVPFGAFTVPASKSTTIKIGLMADTGTGVLDGMRTKAETNAERTYQGLYSRHLDVILHIGDLSYALGHSASWDLFLNEISPLSSHIPYMTSMGNHDFNWGDIPEGYDGPLEDNDRVVALPGFGKHSPDSGGECGVPTARRFIMPVDGVSHAANTPEDDELQLHGWYAFNQGPAAIIQLNSELPLDAKADQFHFLTAVLSKIDRSKTPWVMVTGHRNIYSSSSFQTAYADLENLLFSHQVDFYVGGHMHLAERSCPMYQSVCNDAGIVHLLVGHGGFQLEEGNYDNSPWNRFHDSDNMGFAELAVDGPTATVRFITQEGVVVDQSEHHRPDGWRRLASEDMLV